MKIAEITSKNCQTGQMENEGKAVLLNCMDRQGDRGFYEVRFIDGLDTLTHCRWISDSDIKKEEV